MTATVREARPEGSTRPETPGVVRPRRPRLSRPARPSARPMTTADEPRLVVSSTFAMASLLCLWLVLQLLVLGGLSHTRSQALLYRELRSQLAQGTAPLGPVTAVGTPIGLLSIPALGVEETVVEGTTSAQTVDGPGHLRDTVLPGQVGTSVVMGRAQTYGGPFGDLGDLHRGDTISTTTAQGTTQFTVLGVRRAGDEIPQPLATGAARLVLITSESGGGSTPLSGLSSGEVLYVDADATAGQPAPAGLPVAVPDAELPQRGDSGSLPLLVVYLVALLAVSLGIVWVRQRHRIALVWVLATPMALAVTWATTDVLVRMLPNLM